MRSMTEAEILASFENIPLVFRKALHGMTREQLMARPVPGRWSTHEVAIHCADADQAIIHRLKRIIAEDRPSYYSWSEDDFIAKLMYHEQSAEDAVQMIEVNHRQTARMIKALPTGWQTRVGVHSLAGPETALDQLHKASWHISHHLKFVEEKKAILGL